MKTGNEYVSSMFYGKELYPEKVDSAFRVVLKNFMLYKAEGGSSFEDSYFYMESFLYDNFYQLSSENKKYAERFLEIFSKSEVCGPTYAYYILTKDISFGEREEEFRVAAKRLAAAVYTLNTPFVPFVKANSRYLAIMFQKGWISGYTREESAKKAAIVLFRNKNGEVSDQSLFNELGIDVMDLLKNELYPYCEKEKDSWRKNETMEECMQDRFFICDVMDEAAKDICASLLTEEERTQKTLYGVASEYFSNPENYPDLSDVDLDALIANSETKQKSPSTEDYLWESLQRVFDYMTYRIHFKANAKFDCKPLGIYYIGFSDMSGRNYYIRERIGEEYADDTDPIIAKYFSMKEIIEDGWRPD